MARVNGMGHTNGFEAPPSSMLATHIRPGAFIPHLDQEKFTQLLEESLGHDEAGRPNLGDDLVLNQKLVMVVLQVGIDPFLAPDKDNPFHSKELSGRDLLQAQHCVDVLHLATIRTRYLLYQEVSPRDSNSQQIPLYSHLLPKLFSLVAQLQRSSITNSVFNIISTAIQRDTAASIAACFTFKIFLYDCLAGFVKTISRNGKYHLDSETVLEDSCFSSFQSVCTEMRPNISQRFSITRTGDALFLACQLATFLSKHDCEAANKSRLNKQIILLQRIVTRVTEINEQQTELENLKSELKNLSLGSISHAKSSDAEREADDWHDSGRERKRPRLSNENDDHSLQKNTAHKLIADIDLVLANQMNADSVDSGNTFVTKFETLTEVEQCTSLDQLGIAVCRLATAGERTGDHCPICDGRPSEREWQSLTNAYADKIYQILLRLKTIVNRRHKLRLVAIRALRRVINHASSSEVLRLKGSNGGEWCLQALRSSSREVKIVACRTLQAFVCSSPARDASLLHDNRVVALEFLQALWKEDHASSQEVVVLALTQMARLVGDEDMNIILLRLVEYLGHQNAYISALVYGELQVLAQDMQTNPAGLFRPFWRTLSVVIIQNFVKRPAIAQQVSEIMGMQVDGLLQIMEEHALPYMVLNRDQNLIHRVCTSSSSPMTPFELCTKLNTFPRILAFLLMQGFQNPEQSIMNILLDVSEEFGEHDLGGWVYLYPIEIACELLKSIGDTGRGKASKTYQGLQLLAQLQTRRSRLASSSSSSKRSEVISSFLEHNALAIVTHFTNKLNNIAIDPIVEKRRYLIALGEVVKLGKGQVNVALPHICACLRAAMEDRALCNVAFNTWCDMMTNIDEDEIRILINQTFAITTRSWPMLDSHMQARAYNLMTMLFKEYESIVREMSGTLPSLASVPIMSKFEMDIEKLKKQRDDRNQLAAFISRLKDENSIVVDQALVELSLALREKQEFVHKSILREQPENFVAELTRAILDANVKFKSSKDLLLHTGQCLGAIGCLDSSKIESIREKKRFIILNNFANAEETVGFLMFFMEQILVKEYVSSSNLREKGFLAWALQRLLQICDLPSDMTSRARIGGLSGKDRQWFELSDTTRLILEPFLTSKFTSLGKRQNVNVQYPFYKPGMTYKAWLTEVTLDFLTRGSGDNVDIFFDVCCRLVVHGQGTSVASFLLPYAALNLLVAGSERDRQDLFREMSWVLQQSSNGYDAEAQDHLRQCSQSVFDMLDHMSLWLQGVRKYSASAKARIDRGIKDPTLDRIIANTQAVESMIALIPPQTITQKALECRSFARALFHQEQYVMSKAEPSDDDFRRLQDIYAQIEEPDGIEGLSAQMQFLNVECEVMEHKKAGRWNAAQSWYEMRLTESPADTDVQVNLMRCLKESGQHDVLIHHFDSIANKINQVHSDLLPFAIEAAWVTDRWEKLAIYLKQTPRGNFAAGVGSVMLALRQQGRVAANGHIDEMFQAVASELTPNSTVSFQASHESRLKIHVLDDIRIMVESTTANNTSTLSILKKRLDILGSNVADKQYVLGVQRAIMHLSPEVFSKEDIAASWMASARLARKAQATQQAFNAVLRASIFGDKSAAIEQAKIMWQEGDHRKAIHTLEGAIQSGAFGTRVQRPDVDSMTVDANAQEEQNDVNARAFVLLGKWLDQAGQTQSEVIIKTFRKSTEQNRRWEKGWYNLGRHYNKILESEKLKPPGKESQPFLTGEAAKLVIDNFLRALVSGNKYMFQTLPKVLTLWLDLVGSDIEHDARRGNSQFHQHNKTQRKKVIEDTNATVKKYLERIQPYALYTILPQLVARICHTDQNVNSLLQMMIVKVVKAFPQQALWTVLATVKSASKDRATRGLNLLRKSAENAKKDLKTLTASEMRDFITTSQKFSDEILRIADFHIEGRVARVSLAREFGFNHKIAPSRLVVPSEACLIPNIPPSNEVQMNKSFRAFPKDPVTISAFLDEARVLPSLQKPRKLSLRGSDGKIYSVLAKPHDDLRKDQRLMEFNTMINRFLKHDLDAAKRRLYIKTYAVIPLNEECGLIEWVDGLMTMRDILLRLYDQRGIKPDYGAVRDSLDKICARSEDKAKDFIEQVQSRFPPVLRQWFVDSFPDPGAWFSARLRYARTSAVMSMVGHVLGLGDRHGENILFEEGSGGILHVDFNCLFDKGLTFEKPECVPFRLTHNMRDAMGAYKHEGPFRRCCEITINLLRNNEDALMTILETFLHDPTTDFQTAGKKRKPAGGYGAGVEVPDTPERMLEGVKGKVRGMLPSESVPLSVGGYVDYMIRQAKDEANLARMYIGWCAFF